MRLRSLWARLWRKPEPQAEETPLRSIVLLLRKPYHFSKEELQGAAEAAWERSFDGQADATYFVFDQAPLTIVKVGGNVLQILQGNNPYLPHTPEVLKQLYQPEQKRAFMEHFAWVSIDSWNFDSPRQEVYQPLARLAQKLSGENCAAVFLPGENILMPNDGTAEQGLWLFIRGELTL